MTIPPETNPQVADGIRRRALLDARSLALARRGRTDAVAATRAILLCTCGSEHYGLPLAEVATVMAARACTAVPGAPEALLGLVAVSGRIVSVLGLAEALGRPTRDASPEAAPASGHFVVLRGTGAVIALAVDRVEGVVQIPAGAAGPHSDGEATGWASEAVSVYADTQPPSGTVALVDPRRLLRRYCP